VRPTELVKIHCSQYLLASSTFVRLCRHVRSAFDVSLPRHSRMSFQPVVPGKHECEIFSAEKAHLYGFMNVDWICFLIMIVAFAELLPSRRRRRTLTMSQSRYESVLSLPTCNTYQKSNRKAHETYSQYNLHKKKGTTSSLNQKVR
jgi:hypothetical protein